MEVTSSDGLRSEARRAGDVAKGAAAGRAYGNPPPRIRGSTRGLRLPSRVLAERPRDDDPVPRLLKADLVHRTNDGLRGNRLLHRVPVVVHEELRIAASG